MIKIIKIKEIKILHLGSLKGQCHKDFLLQVFSLLFYSKAKILGSFQIFLKIPGDIRTSRCTTGINDTSGKFATHINDTGGKFCLRYCWCQQHWWQIMGIIRLLTP
jgi:hypothetical protein